MRRSVVRRLAVAALTVAALGGCSSSTENKEPKVTLTTSGAVSVAQGGNATVIVFIERQNFDKTVSLSVEGAPQGITVLMSPTQAGTNVTSGTLFISATGNADPGAVTLTVKATADGIPDQTITVNVTVTVTGNFSLGLVSSNVTVAQGGGGVVTVLIPRTGSNAGNVSLAATGLPAGITATFSASPTTAASASMTLSATTGVAPGTYSVTITGTSPGLSNQPTTLSVVVIPAPATANVSIAFCADDLPVWFAYQNEGFPWQQVSAAGATFAFAATQKVGVAFAFSVGPNTQTDIFYLGRAELSAFNDRDCSGPKSFTGTVGGLSTGQSARVVMGVTAASASSFTPTFTLSAVNARALDLVATRGTVTSTANGDFLTPDRMIIRRGLNLASGSAIPALDFAVAEAFAPAVNNLTISGLETADEVFLTNTLWTGTSTFGLAHSAELPSSGPVSLNSAPSAQLQAGDLHELSIEASQSSQSLVVGRQYVEYFGAPTDRSAPMGPQLSVPLVTSASSVPYSRMRGQLASQPEYNTSVEFGFLQDGPSGGDRVVLLGASAAFLGGTPTTWDVTIPDFGGVSGLNNAWMLAPNLTTIYFAQANSGRTDLLFGALPAQGDVVRIAFRVALTNTIQMARMRSLVKPTRASGRKLPRFVELPQYLRR